MTETIIEYGEIFRPASEFESPTSDQGQPYKIINYGGRLITILVEQSWYWSDEWQAFHNQAISDLENQRYQEFDTGEDFLTALKNIDDGE